MTNTAPFAVYALYKFVTLDDFEALKPAFEKQLKDLNIKGTLLLAKEGLNGTISGKQENVEQFLSWMAEDSRFVDIDYKVSFHDKAPFHRTKVKLKKEIVTLGVNGIDPNEVVGTYVEPQDWNSLISAPDTIVIDTRNQYEYEIGSFEQALNPGTETFRAFPEYVEQQLDSNKHKKVAMFCTGGIRCEKASAYMKQQGFDEVFHLKGGILNYLAKIDQDQSLWRGECFVFDDRVAVNHDLEKGQYDQCHACRFPITEEQKKSNYYVRGVSCPRCYDSLTDEQKLRFAEREKQVQLAKQRGEEHIGSAANDAAKKHKNEKQQLKLQSGLQLKE